MEQGTILLRYILPDDKKHRESVSICTVQSPWSKLTITLIFETFLGSAGANEGHGKNKVLILETLHVCFNFHCVDVFTR